MTKVIVVRAQKAIVLRKSERQDILCEFEEADGSTALRIARRDTPITFAFGDGGPSCILSSLSIC